MRLLGILLLLSAPGVSRGDEFGLVFSTVLGDSPARINQWPFMPVYDFHPFDVSHLIQSPTGDYYMLGTVTIGKLPWADGAAEPRGYCGTYMTPAICSSVFLARVSADGSKLLRATLLPSPRELTWGAGLASDRQGNIFVLQASSLLAAPLGESYIYKVTPAGEVTTVADIPLVVGTWLGLDDRGNILFIGHHYAFPRDERGYLAVFDSGGKKIKELTELPWNPEAGLISTSGAIYVVGGSFLRKYDPLLAAEGPKALVPGGVSAMRFTTNGDVQVAGSNGNRGFSGVWSDSLVRIGEAKEFSTCAGLMSFGANGELYVASSGGGCFPLATTPGSLQSCPGLGGTPSRDVMLMVVKPGFEKPAYVTYWGGGEDDFAGAILAHTDGSFTVAGSTWSPNFPLSSGAAQQPTAGMSLFLSRIHPQIGPVLSPRCIANAASLVPGPIVPGALLSIFGAGGVIDEIRFDGVAAQTLYSSTKQINVRVPGGVSGATRVEAIVGGKSMGVVEIPVAPAGPGIFTMNSMGTGPAVVTNEDGILNSNENPARPGSTITFYASGVPGSDESLKVFLYGTEPAELIRVERQPTGVVAIQARLPLRPDPRQKGIQICAGDACSRPIDQDSVYWWQKFAPRGVTLFLAPVVPSP
jgi:hypothetical protein